MKIVCGKIFSSSWVVDKNSLTIKHFLVEILLHCLATINDVYNAI